MDKKSKITIITSIIALAIVTIIVTYAYFSARITGIESASTISLTAGTMGIHYAEGNENITVSNIYPKADPWVTKTFTLTGNNTTNQTMEYQVGLNITTNTFKGGQLSFSLEVGNGNVGTSMTAVTNKAITKTSGTMLIGKGSFPGPVTNGVQTYTLKIYFLDTGKDQNINQGAVFNGKITVGDKGSIANVNECTDTAHPTLTQGDEYVNGQYTYRYMQEAAIELCRVGQTCPPFTWTNITDDGWGVVLTNPSSTDPVTTALCTSVNGKQIVSMSNMFIGSSATNLDLSSFDTSRVTNMDGMFIGSDATTLDLSSFDTSNVTNMSYMFKNSAATTLDLSSFDTSNVTDMSAMFSGSAATSIDLSSFDTSSVTDMSSMFLESAATTLDLSSFDTSSVTNMDVMFERSQTEILNLKSFTNESLTSMISMFEDSHARIIDISGFNYLNFMNSPGVAFGGNDLLEILYIRSYDDLEYFTVFDDVSLISDNTVIKYGSMDSNL